MKKLKMKVMVIISMIISFVSVNVYASPNEIHINHNGLELTEKEYEFVNSFYGYGYFETMTQEDYDWISSLDVNNNEVSISTMDDSNSFLYNISMGNSASINGTSYSTNSKKIAIAKSCDLSKCTILTNLTWFVNPTIRSYDVIGARLSGTSLYSNSITTKVKSSSGTSYYSNNHFLTNGFGTSVKLPNNSTNIIVEQKFYTNTGGTVYASYQHATSDITLANSYSYTISAIGYGKVFNFYGNALGVYDGMGGVDI